MNEQKQQNKPQHNPFNLIIIFFLITFVINMLFATFGNNGQIEIGYNQFVELVESGHVESTNVSDDEILVTLKKDAPLKEVEGILGISQADVDKANPMQNLSVASYTYSTGPVDDPALTARLLENGVEFSSPIEKSNPVLNFVLAWLVPILVLFLITRLAMSRMSNVAGSSGGMFSIGKSKAKVYDVEKSTGVTFADVAGQDEAKDSLREIVDYLHNPKKYQKIGAKQPKGALLVGPPGTGKTLLAKAVAGEAKVPFYSLSGSEFVEMFVGVGASRVRDLFAEANKNAPCIIFIDEIDAIGKSRDNQMGSNDEREQTLNQLLSEMDGFDSSKGIMVLAATNRPEVLDKALLRPGRFDRRIIVDKPDLPGREAILRVHSGKVKLGIDVDLKEIALMTGGATGADLANMVNEAALHAVTMNRENVLQEDLVEAVEVVIAGKEKKDRILNAKERRMVAYHEVGHALTSALQKNAQPVQKITIVPRMSGALGYTMQVPEEERYLMTKDELLAQITTLLGGRAAEEVEFGEATTGVAQDVQQATKLARSMVTQYGMSDKFGMMALEDSGSKYLDGRNVSTCSETTGALVDEEVRKIMDECYAKAVNLVENSKPALSRISEYLLEKETISGKKFMELLHEDAA